LLVGDTSEVSLFIDYPCLLSGSGNIIYTFYSPNTESWWKFDDSSITKTLQGDSNTETYS